MGPDNLHPYILKYILKEIAEEIAKPVKIIFSKKFKRGGIIEGMEGSTHNTHF